MATMMVVSGDVTKDKHGEEFMEGCDNDDGDH